MARKEWLFPAWLLLILGAVSLVFALVVQLTGSGPLQLVAALVAFGAFCLGLGLLLRHRLRQPAPGQDSAPEDPA